MLPLQLAACSFCFITHNIVQLAAYHAENICSSCGEVPEEGKCLSWRCGGGAFRTRLSRALKSFKDGKEASIANDFNNLSDDDNAAFKKEHHNKMGAHLKMAVQHRVKITRRDEVIQRALAKAT